MDKTHYNIETLRKSSKNINKIHPILNIIDESNLNKKDRTEFDNKSKIYNFENVKKFESKTETTNKKSNDLLAESLNKKEEKDENLTANTNSYLLKKLNLNNTGKYKHSFDLTLENSSNPNYSTKNQTNNKSINKSRNLTPQNIRKVKIFLFIIKKEEKVYSSKYYINPKIFEDKNVLEFVNEFQIK